jgi:subtilisin family serine protease
MKMSRRRGAYFFVAAAAVLLFKVDGSAYAADLKTLGWESRNNGLDDLPKQIAQLYISLYNLGRLPIRFTIDANGTDVQSLMRQKRLHFGNFFPIETDALICDLNSGERPWAVPDKMESDICERPRQLASPEVIAADMSAHIGGRLPTLPRWWNGPGDILVLPSVEFRETYELVKYHKKNGENIEDIVMARAGCEAFDEKCRAFLDRLNRRRPGYTDLAFEGEIEIPVLALTTVIDISCPPGACAGGFDANTAAAVKSVTGWPAATVPPPDEPISAEDLVPNAAESFKVLNNRVWGGIAAEKFALPDEPLFSFQNDLFEFIDYPWINEGIPQEYQKQVIIGVIDGPANVTHCDLADDERVQVRYVPFEIGGDAAGILGAGLGHSPAPPLSASVASATSPMDMINEAAQPSTAPTACANNLPVKGTDADHATHVLGIIGARWNGDGVAGLNPYAKLRALVIDHEKLKTKDHQEALAAEIKDLFTEEDLVVINVSQGWQPIQHKDDRTDGVVQARRDRIQSVIEDLQDHVLFVAAAGQDRNGQAGIDLNSYCGIYPACLMMPNVIGVIALEGSPDAPVSPTWANTGGSLGIGALGSGVLSTGNDGNFVLLDGSSMAAPQVTAVASLIFAKVGSVTPLQVKNRLLACALPAKELEGKVWSGRLDARCAVEYPRLDRLVLKNPFEVLHGKLVGGRLEGDVAERLELLNEESGDVLSVPWRGIYALRTDPATLDNLILFRLKRPNEVGQSPLERDARLVPRASDMELKFHTHEGGETRVPIRRLVAFVSGIE